MRVIITRRMLPLIVQGASAADVAAIARALADGAVVAQGLQPVCSAPAKPLKAVCYVPVFGLTPAGAEAVRKRRSRGGKTIGRIEGQPELEFAPPPPSSPQSPMSPQSPAREEAEEKQGTEGTEETGVTVAPAKTTGHGGQKTHPPAPESLVRLMSLLVSRYTVDEIAAKIPLDVAQVIRMYKGRRGTSPKTLRRLIEIANDANPTWIPKSLAEQCLADVQKRSHHLPKSWK